MRVFPILFLLCSGCPYLFAPPDYTNVPRCPDTGTDTGVDTGPCE
jgi:hypothetical protein